MAWARTRLGVQRHLAGIEPDSLGHFGVLAWLGPPWLLLAFPGRPLGFPWPPLGRPLVTLWLPLASPWPPFGHPWRPLGVPFGVILASRINGQVRKTKGSEKIWALAPIGALRRSNKANTESTVLLNALEICIDRGQKENDAFEN